MDEPQESGEPWEWHIVETFKGLVALGIEALKASALINGGAAVAVLAYLGNVASKTPGGNLPHLKWPLMYFCGGLFLTLIAFLIAYASHSIDCRLAALIAFTSSSASRAACSAWPSIRLSVLLVWLRDTLAGLP
jgi:hypothetical protein